MKYLTLAIILMASIVYADDDGYKNNKFTGKMDNIGPLATPTRDGRMTKEDKQQTTAPALKRYEFYGSRGVTLNGVGGYAFAKWRNYGDGWSDSLDRVTFGIRKSAELGMTTVTDWAVPGNLFTDYRATYLAAGDFTGRNFAADDWSALDITLQLARQNKMQVVLRVPSSIQIHGDTPTKYSSTDYLNKYLKPLWGYIATRYASYADVIACIDWGFEVGGRYNYDSTFFSNALTNRVGYMLADEWVSTHIALRNHIQSIAPDLAVALPSTYDWIANGTGQSVAQMLDHLNEINPTYVNAFDRYALIDYYSNWDSPTLFSMVNNDPLDDTSYWGNTAWLTDGTWDEITQESVAALDSYGRTDVLLGAPEGGHYLMLQDTYNMTSGSGVVTLSLGGHNFLTTAYLTVGEAIYIGNDGVEYTVVSLGEGSPAGSQMTVSPVSADNKADVRIYRKEHEFDQYWAMRWAYKKAAQPGSRWGFFNWFMFWDNSTNKPLDYIHYKAPGVSVYAQQGMGFIESDTLKETVRASVLAPKPADMQWFPRYMSNDAAHGQLSIFSNVSTNSANPSVALSVKKTFNGGAGGIASFESDGATAATGTPFLLRRSNAGGAVVNNTGGGTVRFQFHDGTDYRSRADVAAQLLDTTSGATILKFTTSLLNSPTGGVSPALVLDEYQNTQLRNDSPAAGSANSGKLNLILSSNSAVSPSSPVADSVAMRGADLNGAGTTGLKILTEDNHTFDLGSSGGVAGVYVDGVKLTNTAVCAVREGAVQFNSVGTLSCHAGLYYNSDMLYSGDLNLGVANPQFLTDDYTTTGAKTAPSSTIFAGLSNRIPVLTAGYIPFSNGTGYTGDAAFQWDNTNKRFGIGSAATTNALEINSTADSLTSAAIRAYNTNSTGTSAGAQIVSKSDSSQISVVAHGTGRTATRYGVPLGGYSEILTSIGNGLLIGSTTATPIVFGTNGTEKLRIASSGKIGIGTTTPRALFDNASSAGGRGRIINGSATNYTVFDQALGLRFAGTSTTWNDLRVEPTARSGAGIATAPTFAASPWDTLLFNYAFANAGGEYLYYNVQMPHEWKEGSSIYPHAHFVPHTTGTGQVDITFYCSWATPMSGTFGTGSTYTASYNIASNSQYKHLIASNATAQSMAGMTLSSLASCRITRSAADTYAGDISLLYLDLHYEVDSPGGSDTEYSKTATP